MNDEQLLRYSRHLLLNDIDIAGQEKLLNSHALVIGAGGLGSACAPYLAAAGIGQITLVDHDVVELTYDLAGNGKANILKTAGSVKLVAEKNGPVLGIHMVGARVAKWNPRALSASRVCATVTFG